jgi:rhodanese-related sulfurtransferase
MLNFFKKLFGASEKPDLKVLIDEGAFLVDVRSPQEYAQSKVKGSVNIPLDNISKQIAKFKDKKQIIVFCRSGNRSSQAKAILQRNGFTNVVNGGTAGNVNQFVK